VSAMPRAMIISLFYALFFIAHFESFKTTTSLHTGALFTLVPFITALFSMIIFKESISKRQLLAYLLCVLGSCWIIFSSQLDLLLSFTINKGDLIFMVAVLAMSLYSIARKLLYRNDEIMVLVFATLLGGSFWMLVAFLFSTQTLSWHLIEGRVLFELLYLIVGATLITVYLLTFPTQTPKEK
jgi:drug/metabolite transporter (DMT)-like permease